MTEKEKRDAGLWYDANYDKALLKERMRCDNLVYDFNNTRPDDEKRQRQILGELMPDASEDVIFLAPLYLDYGDRCKIGKGCFFNHNTYLMDGGGITFGDNVFVGPFCGFYTANHPKLPDERNEGLEIALPITVGDNVWFGANVTVTPGVTIGSNSVIAAGSVVTKDIPEWVIAAGNPAKVLRQITKDDTIKG